MASLDAGSVDFIDPSKLTLPPEFSVCIIGESRGIGAGIAHAYALAGARKFFLAASSVTDLEQVADQIRTQHADAQVEISYCDITLDESIPKIAAQVEAKFERLDVVVYVSEMSGPAEYSRVEEGDPRDFERLYRVNVQGLYLTARFFLPLLRPRTDEKNGSLGMRTLGMQTFIAVLPSGDISSVKHVTSRLAQAKLVEMIAKEHEDEGILAFAISMGAGTGDLDGRNGSDHCKSYPDEDGTQCGRFCASLMQEKRMWLSGRMLDSSWDLRRYSEKEEEVVGGDLFKFRYVTK